MSTDIETENVYAQKVKKICGLKIAFDHSESEVYQKQFDKEYEDLLNWKKYRGIDKAKELIELARNTKEPINSNKSGSLILFLLGISALDPIKENLKFRQKPLTQGEFPDIDMDFDGNASVARGEKIRDKVKHDILEAFGGNKHVCSIGTYGCYRTKMAIIDVARALGYDVKEANAVTKEMDALKGFAVSDEEDEEESEEEKKIDQMSLDEVAKVYPALQKYFEEHKDVKEHVEKIRGQVKSMSSHAGGVIITDMDLDDVVPFGHTTSGFASAWTEGIAGHELSAVGLIKFDVLGLNHLAIVNDALRLINERHGTHLTRRDIPIDDHESIRKGAKEGLEGIFQLDSPATKPVVDATKMDSLADITAITALIRPGPKDMGIDAMYARRKNGESYEAPQFWKDALADTYGCMIYQEQIMLISRVLAGFTPSEANKLRKACAKKVPELLVDLKKKFVAGAQKRIEAGELSEEQVEKIWEEIQSFGAYGFNKCLSYKELVKTEDDIKQIKDVKVGDKVYAPKADGTDGFVTVLDVMHNGKKEVYKARFSDGNKIVCTLEHKFLCDDGKKRPLREIVDKWQVKTQNGFSLVESVSESTIEDTMDLEVDDPLHCYYASGLAVSNSHAAAYSALTAIELYLKHNYPLEFFAGILNCTMLQQKTKEKETRIASYIRYLRNKGTRVLPVDVNKSKELFTIEGDMIRFAMSRVKTVGSSAPDVVKCQPFSGMEDFLARMDKGVMNKTKVFALVCAGGFDSFYEGDMAEKRNKATEEFYKLREIKEEVPRLTKDEWKEKEIEYTSVNLSDVPVRDRFANTIEMQKYKTIEQIRKMPKGGFVFGEFTAIDEKMTKSQRPMLLVTLDDGYDSIKMFVFENNGAITKFKTKVPGVGSIGAIPAMRAFSDSDTLVFDAMRYDEVMIFDHGDALTDEDE